MTFQLKNQPKSLSKRETQSLWERKISQVSPLIDWYCFHSGNMYTLAGWWLCKANGKVGWAPPSYLEKHEDIEASDDSHGYIKLSLLCEMLIEISPGCDSLKLLPSFPPSSSLSLLSLSMHNSFSKPNSPWKQQSQLHQHGCKQWHRWWDDNRGIRGHWHFHGWRTWSGQLPRGRHYSSFWKAWRRCLIVIW